MSKREEAKEAVGRLCDEMAYDALNLTDEEAIAEAVEEYGSIDNMMSSFSALLDKAEAQVVVHHYDNVLQWPTERKQELIALIELTHENVMTKAARNGEEGEDDVDFTLNNYIKLRLIDDKGNLI